MTPLPATSIRQDQTSGFRSEAVDASLGCGNPTALIDLREGETVLDLGSGGGIDVLLSARRVGATGKVYGLDMTDEMLDLARDNQRKAGVENVEFLERRYPGDSPPLELGRRRHFELRDQPRARQEPGARRGVPRPQTRRPVRGVGRRSSAAMSPPPSAATWSCGSGALPERSTKPTTGRSLAPQASRMSTSRHGGYTTGWPRKPRANSPARSSGRENLRNPLNLELALISQTGQGNEPDCGPASPTGACQGSESVDGSRSSGSVAVFRPGPQLAIVQ